VNLPMTEHSPPAEAWWQDDWKESFPEGVTLSIIVPVYNERYLVAVMLRQLIELQLPGIATIEIVVVDDGSTDGSAEIVRELAAAHADRLRFFPSGENQGKGAAIRRGVDEATGDLIVIQDADLEYDPRDLGRLTQPFWEDGADVVYGSRFSSGGRRRVVYFRHSLGNNFITFLSNWFTDLNLTDVETCYKMFRAPLLKSIPIRSNDFALEIELTAKIAKRNCTVFEVPISYRGRTYREGKKIGWKDGVKALLAILRYWLVDDLYKEDEYGGHILHSLERAQRFNNCMADTITPWLGDRVLEVGSGIGNMTQWFIPRDYYVASDINSNYLHYLRNFSAGKPYLKVARVDLDDAETFAAHREAFDTVICLNVLEHVPDPLAALRNIHSALVPGGRLVLYVPRGQNLYSTLDDALGHRCRYEPDVLLKEFAETGFECEHLSLFNRSSVPGWWWNGKVTKKRQFSRVQLKIFDVLVPVIRRVDRLLPWKGLGIVAVARKKGGS
jgi:glycosyltransferase involved in cell wall biosynthesis